jgi:SAM-dependent methyltransferase
MRRVWSPGEKRVTMSEPAPAFYSSSTLHVAIYDSIHAGDIPGGDDIGFFRSLAEQTGGPVLELGCGSGRVAIPLAEAGFEVVGVDRSTGMLGRARARAEAAGSEVARRLRFVEGDMTTTRAGEGFGLAFAAFRVFMSILEPDDQLQTLRLVRDQLRTGGLLAIDVFDPRLDLIGPDGGPARPDIGTYPNPDTGRPVRVTVLDRRNDPVRQRFTEHWEFAELDELGHAIRVEIEALTLRWTFRHEMRHLLVRAGFEPVAEYSDYAGSPPAYGREQIWLARPAPS